MANHPLHYILLLAQIRNQRWIHLGADFGYKVSAYIGN